MSTKAFVEEKPQDARKRTESSSGSNSRNSWGRNEPKPDTIPTEHLHYSVKVEDVSNNEFRGTIENWIADFASSEDWIGYDQLYEDEDYQTIVQTMKLLDPHYTKFKNVLKLDNYPDGIYADMGIESEEDRLHIGTYRLETKISATRTLETPITVHVLKARRPYQSRECQSERQITLTFLHELAHHLQYEKGLNRNEDENDMVRMFYEFLPTSYLPLFEELVREANRRSSSPSKRMWLTNLWKPRQSAQTCEAD